MVLLVNVGNTHTALGIIQGEHVKPLASLSTQRKGTGVSWKRLLRPVLVPFLNKPWTAVVAAGVVPEVTAALTMALESLTQTSVHWITAQSPLPIKNLYRPGSTLGMDRLLNAVAAVHRVGAPVVVVDAGTAINLDVVDAKKRFIGGAILPGVHTALQGLTAQTSQLSQARLIHPKRIVGRSTEEGLASGIVIGTGAAVAVLVAEIRREYGPCTRVLGTGGGIHWILPYCPDIETVCPHLALEGLQAIWMHSRAKRSR